MIETLLKLPILLLGFVMIRVIWVHSTFCEDYYNDFDKEWRSHRSRCLDEAGDWSACCAAERTSMIERWKKVEILCPLSGNSTNPGCPVGWIRIDSACYFFSKTQTTWGKAKYECRNLFPGGNLVVPTNKKENDFISEIAVKKHLYNPWIGLHRDDKIFTVYGSKPRYTNWYPGEPNNVDGHENCVHLQALNRKWNDNTCNYQRRFICERREWDSANHSCPVGWIRLLSACYFFNEAQVTWVNAKSECRNLFPGGNLVVPRNKRENDIIWETAQQKQLFNPWIGLHRPSNIYTVYGSKPLFTNWSAGEPNNVDGHENCVHIQATSRQWNDNTCSYPRRFICEYRKSE